MESCEADDDCVRSDTSCVDDTCVIACQGSDTQTCGTEGWECVESWCKKTCTASKDCLSSQV